MSLSWTHYADLVLFKARSELLVETSRTYIGIAWWVLDPVLYMAVFYLVFEVFLERGGANFVQFLLVGLVFFRWFGNAVSNGSTSIRQGHGLMQQVYLPKIVFPLVSFLSDSFKFACTLLLLLPFLWISGFEVSIHYLALPVLLLIQLALNLGCLLIAAAILPLVPDLKYLITHGIMVMLFTSGIFYEIQNLPLEVQGYVLLNPLANLITAYRDVLIAASWPDFRQLLPAIGVALMLLITGVWLIVRLDRRYPKIVRVRGA
ncbi:MAG: ABC transporter permease [Pseudomonadota bacterium]